MAGRITKVQSGDRFAISATTFNTIADVVNDWFARQRNIGRGLRSPEHSADIILIRNDDAADRARFDVLGISGTVLTPGDDDSLPLFAENLALTGITPTISAHWQRYAILLEPIKAGEIGRARVAGTCLVRVAMQAESDTQAIVKDLDATQLQSCAAGGTARLLWVEPVGVRQHAWAWAIAHLGLPPGETFVCKVKKDGGSQGVGGGAPASWTYSIFSRNADLSTDTPLATSLTPKKARAASGPYTYAPDGSFGLVLRDADSYALLIAYGEVEQLSNCDACS